MKREIKFRGLRIDGKGWVYGYYRRWFNSHNGIEVHIISNDYGDTFEVTPESIGQFTGLKDKNGVDIYEGDVLRCEYWEGFDYVVRYEQDDRYIGYWFPKDSNNEIEIIGNIHETK